MRPDGYRVYLTIGFEKAVKPCFIEKKLMIIDNQETKMFIF
jgi:hypothetical protein